MALLFDLISVLLRIIVVVSEVSEVSEGGEVPSVFHDLKLETGDSRTKTGTTGVLNVSMSI